MSFYKDDFYTIECDEQNQWVFTARYGFAQGSQMRNGANKIIELVRQKKATKVMTDLRKMKVVNQEDQKWLNEDWMPRLMVCGLKFGAMIVPENVLGAMSLRRIVDTNTAMETMYFSNLQEAKDGWQTNLEKTNPSCSNRQKPSARHVKMVLFTQSVNFV